MVVLGDLSAGDWARYVGLSSAGGPDVSKRWKAEKVSVEQVSALTDPFGSAIIRKTCFYRKGHMFKKFITYSMNCVESNFNIFVFPRTSPAVAMNAKSRGPKQPRRRSRAKRSMAKPKKGGESMQQAPAAKLRDAESFGKWVPRSRSACARSRNF